MKQPELGKKIAELRKTKSLTQEELVEKCNLNVRTLQRIESGLVTPRSYTIKTIFTVLEFNDSFENIPNRFSATGDVISKWTEQLYRYVIDLFNLKTNKMKKIIILSFPFLTVCLILTFSYISSIKAQTNLAIREKLEKTSSNYRFMQMFNSGQIDSIGFLYSDNASSITDLPPTKYTKYGRKEIVDYNKHLYDNGYRFVNFKSTSKIVSDSIAVEEGVWFLSIDLIPVFSGTFINNWHYINGQWLIEKAISKRDLTINPEAYKEMPVYNK
jgi:transcriptional regulator with XRE-family HTH domain